MTQTPPRTRTALREAVLPHLNKWGPWRLTRDEISAPVSWRFLEVVEDGNPVYWDEEFAKQSRFGRLIAPPQAIFSFTFAPWWTPNYLAEKLDAEAAALNDADVNPDPMAVGRLTEQFGYTVATVTNHETEFIAPFGPGDGRLKSRSMTTDVSEEKQTRPGRGVFITTVTEYYTEKDDRLVARSTMVLLRYDGSTPREQRA